MKRYGTQYRQTMEEIEKKSLSFFLDVQTSNVSTGGKRFSNQV